MPKMEDSNPGSLDCETVRCTALLCENAQRVLVIIVTYHFLAHFLEFCPHVGSKVMKVTTITTSFLSVCAKALQGSIIFQKR